MTFKQRDIQLCACCEKGIMHPANPLGMFWRISAERLMVDRQAVQRQHGLELMMGAAAPLAQLMGPDEDMAKSFGDPAKMLICESCILNEMPMLFEAVSNFVKRKEEEEKANAERQADIGGASRVAGAAEPSEPGFDS